MVDIWTPVQKRLVLSDYWAVVVQISHTFQVSEYLDVMYGAEARIMPRDLRISPRSARSRSIFSPTKSFFSENYKITQTLLKRSETVFQVLTNFNINNYGRLSCTEVVFRCENWKSIDQKLAFQSWKNRKIQIVQNVHFFDTALSLGGAYVSGRCVAVISIVFGAGNRCFCRSELSIPIGGNAKYPIATF